MNPLSAIRFPVAPEMLRAMSPAVTDATPQAIPLRELGKLSAGNALQPTELGGSNGSTFESTLGRMIGDVRLSMPPLDTQAGRRADMSKVYEIVRPWYRTRTRAEISALARNWATTPEVSAGSSAKQARTTPRAQSQ